MRMALVAKSLNYNQYGWYIENRKNIAFLKKNLQKTRYFEEFFVLLHSDTDIISISSKKK